MQAIRDQLARPGPRAVSQAAPLPLVSDLAGDADLTDLIEEFVGGLTTRVQTLEQACAGGDFERLAQLAHQLKGAAGGYGFPSLTELAADLEKRAQARESLEALRNAVQRVSDLCQRAQAGTPANGPDAQNKPAPTAAGGSRGCPESDVRR